MSTPVEITRLNDSVCMGWVGRISVAVWRKTPDDAIEWFAEELKRGIAKHGKGLGHLPVLEAGAPPWSPNARQGLMKHVRTYENELDHVTVIIGGTGFGGSVIRAMGAGMLLLAMNTRVKIKIVGSEDEAGDHLGTVMPDNTPRITRASLREVLTTMRSEWTAANGAAAV